MPRNGSGIYSMPAGTLATTQTEIESAKYNAFASDLAADANAARPVVAGGTGATTAALARTNLGAQEANDNLAAIAALTLAANKGIYATGATTADLFDLTAAGRALLDDADAAAQRVTLGLGAAIVAAARSVTDADTATESGFYTLAAPFTNGPTAANHQIVTIAAGPNTLTQIASLGAAGSDAIYFRQRFAGTWRAWVRLVDLAFLTADRAARRFESAPQAVALSVSVAHGLGAIPFQYSARYRCATAEHGYDIGDEIDVTARDDAPGQGAASTSCDATNISWSASVTTIRAVAKGGTTLVALTPANWRLVFRASI